MAKDEACKKKKNKKKRKDGDRLSSGDANSQSKKKKERKHSVDDENHESSSTDTKSLRKAVTFPHKYILAPMVGASELAFRLLCRQYGAQAAYTPMMSAHKFAHDPAYRQDEFQTCAQDRPLVCHFAANTPEDFAAAARVAEPYCDAIDLNLGCPQRTAYLGHFGSYLLDEKDRALVCSIVQAGAQAVQIPICCKIRLLDTIEETIRLCQELRDAGASLIAVHGRYRASWERKGPGARDGPALMDQIGEIKKAVGDIPIIANGNTITFDDVENNLKLTQADGLMSAEGILDDPALYLPQLADQAQSKTESVAPITPNNNDALHEKQQKLEKKLRKIARIEKTAAKKGLESLEEEDKRRLSKKDELQKVLASLQAELAPTSNHSSFEELQSRAEDKIGIAEEYLSLATKYPVKVRSVIFHTRRILKLHLDRYQSMEECLACQTIDDVKSVVKKIKHYNDNPGAFVFDKEKAKQEKEALERKKREEGKRKAYEARMIRKAKREGLKDLMHYLSIGAEVPSQEVVCKLKAMPRTDALSIWKEKHSQHCLSFHLEEGGCNRGRTCAFLHVDVLGSNTFEEKDEVAG